MSDYEKMVVALALVLSAADLSLVALQVLDMMGW